MVALKTPSLLICHPDFLLLTSKVTFRDLFQVAGDLRELQVADADADRRRAALVGLPGLRRLLRPARAAGNPFAADLHSL